MTEWSATLLVITAGVVLLAVVGIVVSLVLVFFPAQRRLAGRVALWSGIVLVVSAGLCFGILPLVAG